MASRRDFLAATAAAAALSALPATGAVASGRVGKPLKILVLGGTGFLGPHFVAAARAHGHALTLFNRGKTAPDKFSEAQYADIEQLRGDRKSDMSALDGRRWDAVLDTSAYLPGDVTRSASLLADKVKHYLIISTISVYARMDTPGMDETGDLAKLADPAVQEVNGETYGGLKVLSEQAAEAAMPGRVTVIRPGLIVGPGDPTDRFTYWPARFDRGGEVLAPAPEDAPTQFIDVRDLAQFILLCLERRTLGIFNADAQAGSITFGRFLQACQDAAKAAAAVQCLKAPCPAQPGARSSITWIPAAFLAEQKVAPWSDLPAWVPAEGDYAGFGQISNARAVAAGLGYRPLEQTVGDTLAWWRALPAERRAKPRAGLTPEREAAALAAWHARPDATG
ncbi:MAG: NAD-dependent epimerase/dehydratase family protein [Arenimonas sp.]|nr:NAD-dependent epimerase/dehydratase family protein [Arenimonas sp.]MBP6627168.1 NAD-dependent epimerase/dehydratase family protein [Arenimonas sp.]